MSSNASAKVPKMPFFEETKDDIDSYLRRFERYATAQKWNAETWAVNLSALLRGRALDVYSLLPQERAQDYATLKAALLKRFEKTEDGFTAAVVTMLKKNNKIDIQLEKDFLLVY